MPSSQEPVEIVDAPDAVLELAEENGIIAINLRPDNWPKEMINKCKNDSLWQIRMMFYHGYFTSPWLTDFLLERNPGDNLLVCVQDACGAVAMIVDRLKEVFWIDMNDWKNEKNKYGTHAAIRLEKSHRYGYDQGQIWGNYTLAISRVQKSVRPTSRPDPNGQHFIQFFQQYGIK